MQIKSLVVGVLSALSLSVTVAHAATTTVNGGTVHFEGEVVNAACAVDAGSVNQTVQLGQVKASSLSAVGETSSAVGFNIQLDDCDTTVAKTAAIAFAGVTATSNDDDSSDPETYGTTSYPDVLALQGSAAGSASNVGIQILDSTGSALKLDGASFSTAQTLIDGTNTLPFQARYYALGEAKAGTANADATFQVQYQ
ncbi:type 1 fimbrial major subunit FimA, partial [Tatumella sp. UBA2305]|uniref:type 1 fimbrial major subunit FimA n=1 Tax=Tatumella sp. UBA2305 TaxID=1947647 RepID=UPI0025D3F5C3